MSTCNKWNKSFNLIIESVNTVEIFWGNVEAVIIRKYKDNQQYLIRKEDTQVFPNQDTYFQYILICYLCENTLRFSIFSPK